MFLHADIQHLESNLSVLVPASYSVANHFGITSALGVFFGGGVFAALESWGKQTQQKQEIITALSFPEAPAAGLAESLQIWWNNGVDHAAAHAVPLISKYRSIIGCSAGVSALQGMNAMLWIEELCTLLLSPSDLSSAHGEAVFLTAVPNVLSVMNYYGTELANASSGERTGIDHAGHLAGFGFGVGCFVLTRAASRYYNNGRANRRRDFGGGRATGRRRP
jgi:membrane associated rhomboid family serine protease